MNCVLNNHQVFTQILSLIFSIIMPIISGFVSISINRSDKRFLALQWRKETVNLIQEYFSNSFDEKKMQENGNLYHKIFTNILFLFDDEILNKFEEYRMMAENLCLKLGKEKSFRLEEYYKIYQNLIFSIKNYKKDIKY